MVSRNSSESYMGVGNLASAPGRTATSGEQRRKEEGAKEHNAKQPTAMELVTPSSGRRTLWFWCELPQVIHSGLLGITIYFRR